MTDTSYTDAATGREWVREDAHIAAITEARREALREAKAKIRDIIETDRSGSGSEYDKGCKDTAALCFYEITSLLDAPAPAPAQPSVQEAARDVVNARMSTYRAKNGRQISIEGDDGEKCWIVPFDEMDALDRALASEDQTRPTICVRR